MFRYIIRRLLLYATLFLSPILTHASKITFGYNIRRLLLYATLFLSPILVTPVLQGIINGALFNLWGFQQHKLGLERILEEIDSTKIIDLMSNYRPKWGLPEGSFNTTGLKCSDWVVKLGFMLPREYFVPRVDEFYDIASLEGLMRDVQCHNEYPSEQWAYVSKSARTRDDPWDAAFESLLEHRGNHPNSPAANLFYVNCKETPFLCHAWHIRAPCFVRFTVHEWQLSEDAEDSLEYAQYLWYQAWTYNAPADHLRPVKVQIIKLPESIAEGFIPPFVFKNEFELLLNLTTKHWLDDHFQEYDRAKQASAKFSDHMNSMQASLENVALGRPIKRVLTGYDRFMNHHIAPASTMDSIKESVFIICFMLSAPIFTLPFLAYRYAMREIGALLGWQAEMTLFNFDWANEWGYIVRDGLVRDYIRKHGGKFAGLEEGPVKTKRKDPYW